MIGGMEMQVTRVERWLRLRDDAKPRIYRQVAAGSDIVDAVYWLGIIFSSAIATLGLVLNSPAVIIGAMLISPLMSPIMAVGLATAVGDMRLTLRSIATLLASIVVAIAFSSSLVWLLPFHSVTDEILSRTHPTLLDLAIAIVSGLAGSVAAIRAGASEESTNTLPGVAIAVALMPPLCTVGFGLGNGFDKATMGGAGLLFLTNLVAIVFSAFLVFLVARMRTPQVLARAGEFEDSGDGPLDRLLRRPLFRPDGLGGKVHVRALVLLVLLVAIAVPLKKSLTQVVSETKDRTAIQDGLQQLASNDARVSQNVTLGTQSISVDLVTTKRLDAAAIASTEKLIEGRTGKTVHLNVTEVASRADISDMLKRLADSTPKAAPMPVAAPEPTVQERAVTVRAVVGQKLQLVWPADVATLKDYTVTLTGEGMTVTANYDAKSTLDTTAIEVMQSALSRELNSGTVTLVATREETHRAR